MENTFVTITGVRNYYGMKPFKVGKIFRIVKDDDNDYDEEAIRAELPMIDTIGYVANSANTVFAGTVSAGRLYDKIDDYAYAQTMFITHSSVIALVLSPEQVEGDDDTAPVKETESKDSGKIKNKIGF
ncbi:MAG: HIRAN domain-containing protein [Clostridia bacterium]|nr:HIRAN domain-containing protein [Clostridia bacterium]